MRYVAVVKVADEEASNYGVYGPFIDEESVEKWGKMHDMDVEVHELITP
jgi:hypothetical protein